MGNSGARVSRSVQLYIEIHPFFGWVVAASEANPGEPVAAISIGFMSQFICVSLINDVAPGVQLRHPY